MEITSLNKKLELSHSKIQAYLRCPWLYNLVFNEEWRSGPTARQALGNSLHRTLATYLSQDNPHLTLERLFEIYDEKWVNEGYPTPEQTFEAYDTGKKILETFFQQDRLRKDEIVGTEMEFQVDLGPILFRGTVDRIDRSKEGRHAIIEYKTNPEGWTGERLNNNLQLTFYQIGVEKGLGFSHCDLKIYFLSTGEWRSTVRSGGQIEKALALIHETGGRIQKNEFPPHQEYCRRCEFNTRCTKAKMGI